MSQTPSNSESDCEGLIFDVDTFAVHDGPGLRMAVYLKGCPLRCEWCHSPESQQSSTEIVFAAGRCTMCGECVVACPEDNHILYDDEHVFERSKCLVCGLCVERCPPNALSLRGYRTSASRIVGKAVRMKPFFDHSGGGVTLTGGEPTAQPEFAEAVLSGCRAAEVHTAIETCGACRWEELERLVRWCNLVMYDLKIIDDAAHRRWTGASNQDILDNARRLSAWSREAPQRPAILIRVPLIPGITDTDENLESIFNFMRDIGLRDVSLLPYNPSSCGKYEWLGRPYEITGEPQDEARLAAIARMAQEAGLLIRHPVDMRVSPP
jgi:pyruvate formate lyase activating enzyme